MGISGKYKVEMIVEGYKTQSLEEKLEKKEGGDGERDGALRQSQRSERGGWGGRREY